METIHYAVVPVSEEEADDMHTPSTISIHNVLQPAITRVPSAARDMFYTAVFLCHFVVVLCLSTLEPLSIEDSFIPSYSEGLWTSMVMTVTVLGFFAGILVLFLLTNIESREGFISLSLTVSILIQIGFGNILLQLNSRISVIGIIFVIGAFYDLTQYKAVSRHLNFNAALIGFAGEIFQKYGIMLGLASVGILALQTCMLLWWGVFLVDFVGDVPPIYLELIIAVMIISLFWIIQFFHGMMSYVVGGCVVWYFIRPEDGTELNADRVMLHVKCAFSSGLGSLCKGAFFGHPSDVALRLNTVGSSCCLFACPAPAICWRPVVRWAEQNHRLAYCLAATFGKTLSKASTDFVLEHEVVLDILLKDSCRKMLSSVAVQVAGLISLTYGLFAGRKEAPAAKSLFLLLVFIFTYGGVSLALQVYQAAVDAIFVVFALRPEKLAKENHIVFLRLFRASEQIE